MPDWDRFERFLDHHESYVENQTELSVVLAVPLFRIETTMYLEESLIVACGPCSASIPDFAVASSFGPEVNFVYTFHSRLPRPLHAPTQAAS